MRELLFSLQPANQTSLQAQIRAKIVAAIIGGQIPAGVRLPSSRRLATSLKVSRNTVTLAYQTLMDDGFLIGRERSGYFVNPAALEQRVAPPPPARRVEMDWSARLHLRPSRQTNIDKPRDWSRYPYPFVYGQPDPTLFPIAEWRDCSRLALGRKWLESWASDQHAGDDPMLVEQIRTRLLPRRGVLAEESEILVTLGAQHALYLLAGLLVAGTTRVMLENPGYPDVRNIFALAGARITPLPVDHGGLVVDDRLAGADLVYTTPSHQAPTTVTMPEPRRLQLLALAAREDFVIIEDDYEFETNFVSTPSPALKSLDREGRVIYVGSLSKTLFPGLRLGYLVAPPELIAEARALRRLVIRHPPTNAQRTAALFLELGHHDALVMRLRRAYAERWQTIGRAVEQHLPMLARVPSLGGSSIWLAGPRDLDTDRLAAELLTDGVVTEPGSVHFAEQPPPANCLRLGFSSIETARIEPGVRLVAERLRRKAGR